MWHKDVFMQPLNHAYFTDWGLYVSQKSVIPMFVRAFPLGRCGLVPGVYKLFYTTGGGIESTHIGIGIGSQLPEKA